MRISSFFSSLRSAYEAEIDDMASDSEGNNVLRKRLEQRRKELGFLLQMMEVSPEMLTVVFHQGFKFKLPGAVEHVLSHEAEDVPEWDTIADTITLTPWAQELAAVVLQQPQGAWFMSVAAGLEYMFHKADAKYGGASSADEDEDADDADDDNEYEDEEEREAREREEAGADWMVEQGFDRKD